MKTEANDLRESLRAALPSSIVMAAALLSTEMCDLFPEELCAMSSAVQKRRIEFSTGRALARAALRELGIRDCAIPVGKNRAPVWPRGVVGSISHSETWCLAAVAYASNFASIGVDVEGLEPLPAELIDIICRDDELHDGAGAAKVTSLDIPKLLFVIKESIYKAYSPLTGVFLDFHDVRVQVDIARNAFSAELLNMDLPSAADTRSWTGSYAVCGNAVAAWVTVPA